MRYVLPEADADGEAERCVRSGQGTAVMAPPSLWHNRGFRSLWAARAVSQFGDRITELALPLIAVVVVLRATPFEVAVVGLPRCWLPNLLGLLLGAWVDHGRPQAPPPRRGGRHLAGRRPAPACRSPTCSTPVSLVQPYAVALLIGAGEVLFDMANAPFFVTLVPRASYVDANSKLSATRSISFIGGPAVGGVLVRMLTRARSRWLSMRCRTWRLRSSSVASASRSRRSTTMIRTRCRSCTGPRRACTSCFTIRCSGPASVVRRRSTSSPSCPVPCSCCTRAAAWRSGPD